MIKDEIRKHFISLFESLSERYSRHQVWSDFVVMSACAIANACDKRYLAKREAMYTECASRYTGEELEKFAEMLSLVVVAFDDNSEQDFLGDVFGSLRLNNEWRGQFFTPYHVAKLMAKINAVDIKKDVEEKGSVSVNDCCCGAGCLLIAFANAVKEQGVNYQKKVLFVAQDVDLIAGLMCYIQLSILGCKGFVKIGNSLTEPMTDQFVPDENVWFTPLYVFGDLLSFMNVFEKDDKSKSDAEKSA